MLAVVSPLISKNGREGDQMENFSIDFDDFSCGNLLDDINFDDIFIGIGDGDVLPDLEMDSDMFAEFSLSGGEESEINVSFSLSNEKVEEEDRGSGSAGSGLTSNHGEEIVSKRYESVKINSSSTPKDVHKGRKSSKSSHGKRKMKVDWTPELHRRFVQAVEQLGMDKAVPSRILELMGIDCLTRHNIASHLQKYRSHQKHLRAREAEAASWNQRRQIYGGVGGGSKRDMAPWPAPTMGFPPPAPIPPFPRPLHVWGHPAVDKSVMHMWPKHIAHPPSASTRPPWTQPPHRPPPLTRPYPPPPYCHPQQLVPNALTPGTPCFPPTHAPTRFPTPHVPGIPPHPMYKVDHSISVAGGQSHPHPSSIDFHPSKESIDAVIGDVLSKPWLPLPLGLKPPALDSVMGELQRQGVPKIPPSTHAA
ncbi:Two-component response regulator-like aprr2 [Thalictrum thalictroides]|uniref:Two-component response regulator-like aprr2 n=1 Tax=Thalictrum thalictroides TaxID=46969 RepID=A0A7J6VVF5_THATH|nr:Two-component response regulator-like aprr2 [Thalictrum thalictroides]